MFCAYELARHGMPAGSSNAASGFSRGAATSSSSIARAGSIPTATTVSAKAGRGPSSDGKLYTRAHKRGSVRDVLEILALHGAPPEILVDARPHIGSNRLPKVVTALRERLEGVGVEFHFESRLERIVVESRGRERRVCGVSSRTGVRSRRTQSCSRRGIPRVTCSRCSTRCTSPWSRRGLRWAFGSSIRRR